MSEEEGLITEAMVKKATYLIHKLADQKNETFETIRSKCKKIFGYMNLARLSFEDGHKMISKLIELTGGEEETQQTPIKPDDGFGRRAVNAEPRQEEDLKEDIDVPVTGDDQVTFIMRVSVRAAVDITLKEVVNKDVPVQGLGGFVLEIAKVIFEAKQNEAVNQ